MARIGENLGENVNGPSGDDLNPLILKWLNEWLELARQSNSNMRFVYGKALRSFKAHSDPIRSGQECKKLNGFGEKLCAQIDKKLAQHFKRDATGGGGGRAANFSMPKTPPRTMTDHFSVASRKRNIRPSPRTPLASAIDPSAQKDGDRRPPKLTKTNQRRYIPAKDSSPFAILVALLRFEFEFCNSRVNKLDLKEMAQQYCGAPLGWASINTLITKQLVDKTDERYPRYCLTDDGRKLAKILASQCASLQNFSERFLRETTTALPSQNFAVIEDSSDLESQNTCTTSRENDAQMINFIMEAGSYEIVLCIDTRERYSTSLGRQDRAAFATALQNKIKFEIRTLPLGDFVWIAREKKKQQPTSSSDRFFLNSNNDNDFCRELVLDHIIERKRIDDLAGSIKDRRWDEQKFRLRNCGIRRPMYLIEYFGKQSRKQDYSFMKPSTLDQAIINCEMDGFETKRTDSFDETVRYLVNMSRWLERYYSNKSIIACRNKQELAKTCCQDLTYITFNEFCTNAAKIQVFTCREMFIKHLLQIKRLSLAKVNAIVKKYPTIKSLMMAYSGTLSEKQQWNLLQDLKSDQIVGPGVDRRLGPTLSKKICQFYNS